mmetsp:Transcript_5317/g.19288  ORF Transcript_5317/g.19288 Transcript_5317/m.19288 type:complete len:185 (+) Transcript_5317:923-1477(+)
MVPRRPHEGRGVVAVFRNAAVRAAEDGLDGVDGARGREQSAVDGKLVQVDRVVPPPELAQLRPQLMTLRRRRVGVRRNDEPATAPTAARPTVLDDGGCGGGKATEAANKQRARRVQAHRSWRAAATNCLSWPRRSSNPRARRGRSSVHFSTRPQRDSSEYAIVMRSGRSGWSEAVSSWRAISEE